MKFSKWQVKGFDRKKAVALVHSGFNPLVAVILASRGITDPDEAKKVLACGMSKVHDPFLLKDMDKAVERIKLAIDRRENVVVFGDYDVDGMTSSCTVADFLRGEGLNCGIYIPGRLDEGYGLNTAAIDGFAAKNVTLVVTVDCGITAIVEAEHAASLGIDVVITDHHECKEVLPEAVAIVDPKRRDCTYPNKNLAGVGVAFKLVCALAGRERFSEIFNRYIELVAMGTVADVMTLSGENRTFVAAGLAALAKTKRPGLRRLLQETGLDRKRINTGSVGFALTPRLNAAGRMGVPTLAVDLIMTHEPEAAAHMAAELCRLNDERRQLVGDIYDEASEMLLTQKVPGPIVLAKKGWYQGVMGIVAARIAEVHRLPTVMICVDDDGVGRGSCRSFGSFQLYHALEACSDLLINFGGHEMAAGITILEKNIPEFTRRLREYYSNLVKIPPEPTLAVDFEVIKPGLLSIENLQAAERSLEPYGNGNPPPVMCIKSADLISLIPVGGGAHTKVKIRKLGESFEGIFFSRRAEELGVYPGDRVDVAFQPQINDFRGRQSVQLLLSDIRYHTEAD